MIERYSVSLLPLTGTPGETIFEGGGEVAFIAMMVRESVAHKNNIRWGWGGWGIGAQSLNCVLEVRCSLFCSALWSVLSDGLNNYCIDLKCEQFCCAAELLTEDMRGKRKLPRIFVLCIISWQVSFNFIALSPRIGLCVLHKRGTLLFLQICKHVYLVNSILFLYIT